MNTVTYLIGTGVLLTLVGCGGSGGGGGDAASSGSTSTATSTTTTQTVTETDNVVSTELEPSNDTALEVNETASAETVALPTLSDTETTTETTEVVTELNTELDEVETVEEPLPEYEKTADVVVPDEFSLAQGQNVTLSVSIPSEGYVSVCRDFEQREDMSYSIDFNSCVHRQRVSESLSMALDVSSDTESMIAVVYFFDGSEPSYQLWQAGEESLDLIVN